MRHSCCLMPLAAMLFLFGCGGPKTVIYDQPSQVITEHYETVWVDPRILFSDSLVTVIQAARIDSVRLTSVPPESDRVARIGFHVVSEDCIVVVNLAEPDGRILRPLLIQNLDPGFYQLTLNNPLSLEEIRPLSRYLLKADYCGRSLTVPFVSGR